MNAAPTATVERAARRLARLFRIERRAGFERWPPATVRRLLARRAALIAELAGLERRRLAAIAAEALDPALADLRREVERSFAPARARLQRIGKDLRVSRVASLPTGVRDGGGGRNLGTS